MYTHLGRHAAVAVAALVGSVAIVVQLRHLQAQLDDERLARASAETQLDDERLARASAETQLDDERLARASAENAREVERRGRTAAEKQLRQGVVKTQETDGYSMRAIGVIESPFPDRRGTPRQGTVCPATEATLAMGKHISPATLEGLQGFSHVWVVFIFHENTNLHLDQRKYPAKVTPPRLGKRVGLFSTRSPHRPNPIGLTVCQLLGVDEQRRRVVLGGADLVDGTPVLDIKPYVPYDRVDPLVPDWVLPESGLTESMPVKFTEEAEADLTRLFSGGGSNEGRKKSKRGLFLRTYAGRPRHFRACVEQVVQQDPRSAHQGRGLVAAEAGGQEEVSPADGAEGHVPFMLTIDGVDLCFVARSCGLVVTSLHAHRDGDLTPSAQRQRGDSRGI